MIKKIIILGGGVSGLACAYFLPKHIEKIIFESEEKPGGLLYHPRGFAVTRSQDLYQLCLELGLESEMVFSADAAKRRFVWMDGALHAFPGVIGTPWSFALFKMLMSEWKKPVVSSEETIDQFARRRCGEKIASTLFDAMAVGVFGGDSQALSCNASFPSLKNAELKYGSLTKAFFKKRRGKDRGLFSLKGGAERLAHVLAERLGESLRLGERVLRVEKKEGVVHTQKGTYEADLVISALPVQALRSLFDLKHVEIPHRTVYAICCTYDKQIRLPQGFGYIVPRQQKSPILGVSFDTQIFPDSLKTQFTIMTEGSISKAIACVEKHLGIPSPDYIRISKGNIPQYTLGHEERICRLQAEIPEVPLLGNYLRDVSVNGCVRQAKELVSHLFHGK